LEWLAACTCNGTKTLLSQGDGYSVSRCDQCFGFVIRGHAATAILRVIEYVAPLLESFKGKELSRSQIVDGIGANWCTVNKALGLLANYPEIIRRVSQRLRQENLTQLVFHVDPGPEVLQRPCVHCGRQMLWEPGLSRDCEDCHRLSFACRCGELRDISDTVAFGSTFICGCGRLWRVKSIVEIILERLALALLQSSQVPETVVEASNGQRIDFQTLEDIVRELGPTARSQGHQGQAGLRTWMS
jgi:hypothetical protein